MHRQNDRGNNNRGKLHTKLTTCNRMRNMHIGCVHVLNRNETNTSLIHIFLNLNITKNRVELTLEIRKLRI